MDLKVFYWVISIEYYLFHTFTEIWYKNFLQLKMKWNADFTGFSGKWTVKLHYTVLTKNIYSIYLYILLNVPYIWIWKNVIFKYCDLRISEISFIYNLSIMRKHFPLIGSEKMYENFRTKLKNAQSSENACI